MLQILCLTDGQPKLASNLPLLTSVGDCNRSTWSFPTFILLFPPPLPQHTEHSRRKTLQRQTLGAIVTKWVYMSTHVLSQVWYLSFACYGDLMLFVCFFSREMDNFRTETVTADMRLSQRRRRTWRCSGGEGSAVGLSSVIKLHGRWTVKSCGAVHLIFYLLAEIIHLICLFASILSPSAGTLWTSCWKPREPTWRSCSAYCKSVLTPKNGYSSLWPEFHVCLFFLLCSQGYASEMDNPAMVPLMPAPLQNKKEVLFGNMPEIYHFHRRWRSAICLSLMISTHCDLSCC